MHIRIHTHIQHAHTLYNNSHKAGKVKHLQRLLRMRRGNGWENVGKESHTVPKNSHGRFIGGKGENAEIASGVESRGE